MVNQAQSKFFFSFMRLFNHYSFLYQSGAHQEEVAEVKRLCLLMK